MALKDHEKWIKENIGGENHPIDAQELWASLEAHVPKKKHNKKYIFFWWSLGVASFIGLAYFYLNHSTNIVSENQSELITKEALIKNETNISAPNSNEITQGNITEKQINTTKQNGSIKGNSVAKLNSEALIINYKEPAISRINKTEKSKLSSDFINNKSSDILSSQTENIIKEDNDNLNYKNKVAKVLINEESIQGMEGNETGEGQKVITFETLQVNTERISNLNELSLLELANTYKIEIVKSPEVIKANKFILSIAGGASFSRANYKAEHDPSYELLINDISKTLPSSFFNVGLEYKMNKKWSSFVDFNYVQYIDQFKRSYNSTYQEEINGIQKIIKHTNGVEEEIYGNITTYTLTTIQGKQHQWTSNYNVQGGIKYEVRISPRWNTIAGIGINYNIVSNKKGSYLTNERTLEQIDNSILFQTNRWNPVGILQVNYKINRNMTIGLISQFSSLNTEIKIIDNKLITRYRSGNIGLVCQYGIF